MPESPRNADGLARDATRVVVGLGLLGFQRAQVKRREIERSLADTQVAEIADGAGQLLSGANNGIQRTLDAIEAAAPEPATTAIGLARTVVEDGTRALGSRIKPWIR